MDSEVKQGLVLNLRPIDNTDFFRVVDMLLKAKKEFWPQLSGLISSNKKTAENLSEEEQEKIQDETGKSIFGIIFDVLYNHMRQDLLSWFADLARMDLNAFMKLPPESLLIVIEYLLDAQEAGSFFTRAWRLFSKITGLGSQFTTGLISSGIVGGGSPSQN